MASQRLVRCCKDAWTLQRIRSGPQLEMLMGPSAPSELSHIHPSPTQSSNAILFLSYRRLSYPIFYFKFFCASFFLCTRWQRITFVPIQTCNTCCRRDQMNPRSNLHYCQDRLLTLMERKRIQSIPDDVHVSVSETCNIIYAGQDKCKQLIALVPATHREWGLRPICNRLAPVLFMRPVKVQLCSKGLLNLILLHSLGSCEALKMVAGC